MTNSYETMFILHPEQDQEQAQEFLDSLQGLIEKFEGKIIEVKDWGTRRLAYEINRLKEGHYFLITFKSGARIVPELEHFFRVSDKVMRYLVIREKG